MRGRRAAPARLPWGVAEAPPERAGRGPGLRLREPVKGHPHLYKDLRREEFIIILVHPGELKALSGKDVVVIGKVVEEQKQPAGQPPRQQYEGGTCMIAVESIREAPAPK